MSCLFLCTAYFSYAQTLLEQADSLCRAGQHELARLACERFRFEHPGEQHLQNLALLRKAGCYKQEKNFGQAVQTLRRAGFLPAGDSLGPLLHYELALNYYLSGEAEKAVEEIRRMDEESSDKQALDRVLLLRILALNRARYWAEANEYLAYYLRLHHIEVDSTSWQQITTPPPMKKPELARRLSLFPGLGQLYAGYPLRGLASLGLTGLGLGYGVVSIARGYYLSGIFSGGITSLRFYTGGKRHAEWLAEQKNKQRADAYSERFSRFVLGLEERRRQ